MKALGGVGLAALGVYLLTADYGGIYPGMLIILGIVAVLDAEPRGRRTEVQRK